MVSILGDGNGDLAILMLNVARADGIGVAQAYLVHVVRLVVHRALPNDILGYESTQPEMNRKCLPVACVYFSIDSLLPKVVVCGQTHS